MSEEFQSPISIKIPIEVGLQGEDQITGGQQNQHVKSYNAMNKINEGKKGTLLEMLEKDLGASKGAQALGYLRNPQAAVFNILGNFAKISPLIAAVLALPQIIELISTLLFSKGGPFDRTFRNTVNTLNNQFRNREQQQSIRSGFTQVVFTTNAGDTSPRDAYNSYEQKETNTADFQNLRNIRGLGNMN